MRAGPTLPRPSRTRPPSVAALVGGALTVAGWLGAAGPVGAHGPVPDGPPTVGSLLFDWTFEPLPTLAIAIAVGCWIWAIRRVDRAHPANPVPRRRSVAFGLG